jgi:hypothetical protein
MCPSTNPIGSDAQVFGVLTRSAAEERRVGHLTQALPATFELLAAAGTATRASDPTARDWQPGPRVRVGDQVLLTRHAGNGHSSP